MQRYLASRCGAGLTTEEKTIQLSLHNDERVRLKWWKERRKEQRRRKQRNDAKYVITKNSFILFTVHWASLLIMIVLRENPFYFHFLLFRWVAIRGRCSFSRLLCREKSSLRFSGLVGWLLANNRSGKNRVL